MARGLTERMIFSPSNHCGRRMRQRHGCRGGANISSAINGYYIGFGGGGFIYLGRSLGVKTGSSLGQVGVLSGRNRHRPKCRPDRLWSLFQFGGRGGRQPSQPCSGGLSEQAMKQQYLLFLGSRQTRSVFAHFPWPSSLLGRQTPQSIWTR